MTVTCDRCGGRGWIVSAQGWGDRCPVCHGRVYLNIYNVAKLLGLDWHTAERLVTGGRILRKTCEKVIDRVSTLLQR